MKQSKLITGFVLASAVFLANVALADVVKYTVKDGAISKSLTGKPGDAQKGLKTIINRKRGGCIACHTMPIPDQQFHGNVAPDLRGVGSRLSAAQLRLRLVDSKAVNPATSMPAYYKLKGLHRVQKKWRGKTILSAQQIEDIVAYLITLKKDASFTATFRLMRKAGQKTFEWRGKRYATAIKGGSSKTAK